MTREPIDAGNEHFPPTTFQMVNVHCDAGAPNVVPGELKCRFNLRYSNVWTHEQLSARIERAARRSSASTTRSVGASRASRSSRSRGGSPKPCRRPCARRRGSTPELSTSGGTSDGRFIAPYGIDVVELGPINETIHKVNEVVSIADLERLEHIYFRIAELAALRRVTVSRVRRSSAPTQSALERRDQFAAIGQRAERDEPDEHPGGHAEAPEVQLTSAHSPEPVKIILQALEPAERVHDVVEAGPHAAALRPAASSASARANPEMPMPDERDQPAEHRVRARTDAARRVQRGDREHDAQARSSPCAARCRAGTARAPRRAAAYSA